MPIAFPLTTAVFLVVSGLAGMVRSGDVPASSPASQPASRPSRVVDEQLVRKLLGGSSGTLDALDATLAGMEGAAVRLNDRLDPGPQTQRLQKDVLTGIDKLIEQARKNRVASRGKSPGRRAADRRPGGARPGGRKDGAAGDPGKGGKGGPVIGPEASARSATTRAVDRAELLRGWGFLPLKDREEISQGFDEEFLSKYREEIARYYRDLARAAGEKK
jgi:hypothetical protein